MRLSSQVQCSEEAETVTVETDGGEEEEEEEAEPVDQEKEVCLKSRRRSAWCVGEREEEFGGLEEEERLREA